MDQTTMMLLMRDSILHGQLIWGLVGFAIAQLAGFMWLAGYIHGRRGKLSLKGKRGGKDG